MDIQEFFDLLGEAVYTEIESAVSVTELDGRFAFAVELSDGRVFTVTVTEGKAVDGKKPRVSRKG